MAWAAHCSRKLSTSKSCIVAGPPTLSRVLTAFRATDDALKSCMYSGGTALRSIGP